MTLDEAIKHAEEVAIDQDLCCSECAEEHRQLAEWLKQLKEIKRILDAPSYKENGVTYSYCYDSKTKLKHIRGVILND